MNKTSLLLTLFIVLLTGCSRESETAALNAVWELRETSEQTFKDNDAVRRAVVLVIDCPGQFPGAVNLSADMKTLSGEIISGFIPSFSIVDEEHEKNVYLYIKESFLEKHPLATMHASVASDGFPTIEITHTFESDK